MPKYEDAQLILKLYELRREERMREAREWYMNSFAPQSADDFNGVLASDKSGFLRMVMSYWDMAAALVNHGAIDFEMFNDANGEHIIVYAKVAPYLPELRAMYGPRLIANLEKLINATPSAEQTIARWQQRWKDAATKQASA